MAEIFTKKRYRILVDDADFEALNAYTWCLDGKGYARRAEPIRPQNPKQRIVYMHRQILCLVPGDGKQVDHINGNPLDNRRANLRVCTQTENKRNRGAQINNNSGFKGVSFHKQRRKWAAQVTADGKQKYLGLFETPQLAHEMYCLAADMLHGEFANHGSKEMP